MVTASMGMLDIQVTPPNIIQYLYSLHFKFIQYRPLSLVVHFLSKQGMVRYYSPRIILFKFSGDFNHNFDKSPPLLFN